MDDGQAVYVYHQLLTLPDMDKTIEEHKDDIIKIAKRALEHKIRGRQINSLYYFYWKRLKMLGVSSGDTIEELDAILHSHLTKFQLRAEADTPLRHIYIIEPERRGMTVYNVHANEENGSSIIIEASNENVAYTCLGAGQRAFLDEKLSVRRLIPNAGLDLYLHFFQKGDRRFHLLTHLTNYFLAQENPDEIAIPVFEAMLVERSITKPYRMRILVALGGMYYNANNLHRALKCYGDVDEDALDNDFIEQILSVYMQTKEINRAARLLVKKQRYISGQTMYDTVITILSYSQDLSRYAALSEVAYKLLVNGLYDNGMLALVLEHFNASYDEWKSLAYTMKIEGKDDLRLDAKILETAIFMTQWDVDMQRAFIRIYSAHIAPNTINPLPMGVENLISEFVEYAIYEMLANHVYVEYDVLDILENMYFTKYVETKLQKSNEGIRLVWGLSSMYLKHNITTLYSDSILKDAVEALEERDILFPVFKEIKPSNTPFIEKHQTFVYRAVPGKDCWLYYRIDTNSFTAVPMQYVMYGMYIAILPVFYNEEITYYFSEEMASGSIATRESTLKNTTVFLHESNTDPFFTINNAIIHLQMFKHDQAEKIVNQLVKDVRPVKARLI